MSILHKYSGQLRLYKVSVGKYLPPLHQAIFELQLSEKTQSIFVVFSFSSFDEMWLHLKNLTRFYGNCSVERLFYDFYPATIGLLENFSFIETFEKLYLPDEKVWPNDKIKGFILYD